MEGLIQFSIPIAALCTLAHPRCMVIFQLENHWIVHAITSKRQKGMDSVDANMECSLFAPIENLVSVFLYIRVYVGTPIGPIN